MIQHLTEIVEEARKRGKKRLAVAYGQDSHTLEAVYEAYKEGLVEPTLFGDKEVIKQVCQENGIDINAFNIVNEPNDVKCVQQAVASVVSGNADVLMKGLVSTDKYMRGILNKEAGLFPPKGVLSHVSIVEMPCYHKLLIISDVAVIPQYCEDFYAVPQHDTALEAQFAGRFNVVFTGTFTPAQSLDMVVRAVLDARAAGAEHLHLLLVGDGMSREALQKQAADLHAGDAVTFYGSVPAADVPRFTALADALLISLSDSPDLGLTVPGKLASYMAAAKPVLASMNGAGYAAVLESGGGLVSPACDQKALADNMLALYRMTDAERAALGAKAKAYYTAHYRRAELLKRLEDEGLVQRSMGVRDARMKRITPTLRAQALNQEAERRIAATEATLTRGISQEEIDQFLAIAEKLKQNLI